MSEKQYLEAELTDIDGKDYFVATDSTTDREGEVLSIDGWEISNYKRNPVILWGHNANEPPIGIAEGIGFRTLNGKKKMVFKPKFHDITQLAKDVAKMVAEGIIKTVSVGYIPKTMKDNVVTSAELLEVSFVAVPANPEATQLALTKGISNESIKEIFEDKEELEEVLEEVKPTEIEEKHDYSIDEYNELSEDVQELQKKVAWLERDSRTVTKGATEPRSEVKRNNTHRVLIAVQKSCEALTQSEKKGSLRQKQIKNITKLVEYLVSENKK